MQQVPASAEPLTRREFLNYAWLASLGILAAEGSFGLYQMLQSGGDQAGGSNVVKLGRIENLPGPGAAPVMMERPKFFWVNTPRGALALLAVCTHAGCYYDWKPQDQRFICPCHGVFYDPDGTFLRGPDTQTLPSRVGRAIVDPYARDWPPVGEHGSYPGQRSADRLVLRAYDSLGHEVAHTPASGAPVRIPPGSRVVVDSGTVILGPPASA